MRGRHHRKRVDLAGVLSDSVYNKIFDGCLKTGLKNRKIAEEVLGYKELSDELDVAKEALAGEKDKLKEEKDVKQEQEKKAEDDQSDQQKAAAKGGPENDQDEEPVDDDPERAWKQFCYQTVRSHITLTTEPKSEQKFAEFVQSTQLYKMHVGSDPSSLAILFDVKVSGESKWQPNVRVTSLREDMYSTLVRGAMRGFMPPVAEGDPEPPLELQSNLLALLWDGFKHGLEADLLRPFKDIAGKKLEAVKRTVFLQMDPVSIGNRRLQQWDAKHKSTVEFMTMLSSEEWDVPEKNYAGYKHLTNKMDMIGPVHLDKFESGDVWQCTFGLKKQIYGPARVAVGSGASSGTAGDIKQPKQKDNRTDDKIEPVFYLSLPFEFYLSIFKCNDIKGVLNLTSGEGNAELACIEMGVPCVSVCFTETHQSELFKRIEEKVYARMGMQESSLFEKKLSAVLKKRAADVAVPESKKKAKKDVVKDASDDEQTDDDKKRKKKKQKKNPQTKKEKPTKKKQASSSSSSSSDSKS